MARRLIEDAKSRQASLLQDADERGVRLRAETEARARFNLELQSEHESLTSASMGCGEQQDILERLRTDLARAQIEDTRLRAQAAAGAAEVRAECREMATAVLRRRQASGAAATASAAEAAAAASSLAARKVDLERTAASRRSDVRDAEARRRDSRRDIVAADRAESDLHASVAKLRAEFNQQQRNREVREVRKLSVPHVSGRLALGESGSYSYPLSSPRRGALPPTAELPPTASPMASPLKRDSLPRFGDPTPPKERPGEAGPAFSGLLETLLPDDAPIPKAVSSPALPNSVSDVLRSGMSDLGGTGSGGLDAQIQDLESSLAAIIAGNDALEQRILSKSPSAPNVRGLTGARNPSK